ncbi:prion-inhibition and propagation-domain-containing protein [Annulohypoxylon nitens]|nr:prion-inhibition and propagation-domain-containing protein [Annulohypoxylon nitens]
MRIYLFYLRYKVTIHFTKKLKMFDTPKKFLWHLISPPAEDSTIPPISPNPMDATSSALSLLRFAIDVLGSIQFARQFEEEFERHQLKLDVLRLRISRWCELVKNGNQAQIIGQQNGFKLDQVVKILEDINIRLHTTNRDAVNIRKKIQNPKDTQVLDPKRYLPLDLQELRSRFIRIVDKREAQISRSLEAIKWVFYKRENFEKFVQDISQLLDNLDKLIPEDKQETFRQLSYEEYSEMSPAHLEELQTIADGCDPLLRGSLGKRLESDDGSTTISQSYNTGQTVGIHRGNSYGASYGQGSTMTSTFNQPQ